MDLQAIIDETFAEVARELDRGEVASYIPELATADPDRFGACLTTLDGATFRAGDWDKKFSIQSISKVFSLALAYGALGEKLWERVGVEPSGTAFNSLVQLEADRGIPRNPLINAGALVICDVLLEELGDAPAAFLSFVREVGGLPGLAFSEKIARSERSAGFRNVALCHFIKSFGNIRNDPGAVLDFYFNICSLEMDCRELSRAFLFLADPAFCLPGGGRPLTTSQAKRLNAIMQTCGLYDEAGEFTFKVGLPGKSGVGGGVVAVHPGRYSIAVHSPRLNEKGNSHRAVRFLELFTTRTGESIF